MSCTNCDPLSYLNQIARPVYAASHDQGTLFSHTPFGDKPAAFAPAIPMENLGSREFTKRHGMVFPYIAGAMANGIASVDLVTSMADKGMLGFFGAGGCTLSQIEDAIVAIKAKIKNACFGCNLIHSLGNPDLEMATVKLYLDHKVSLISAAAFMGLTLPLVYYRIKGIHVDQQGTIQTPNRIIAKVSREEVARLFFSPPPDKLVSQLLTSGLISQEEARLSQYIPMAEDLTAEADSGGHTDNRPALALLPTMISLKHEIMARHDYATPLCVGLGGGIATPESAAAAFSMGAAYILTGSINQSCREAGICNHVKELLCETRQADMAMAPAADMFEIGARVQVLKRGSLFPIRAEKLYHLYKTYNDFQEIPQGIQEEVQKKILQTNFDLAWEQTRTFFENRNQRKEVERALADPKHKMALVFRSYLGQASGWAIKGVPHRKMDYQIWCGPAMGAFNQWVSGSFLEKAENRTAPLLALNILFGASVMLRISFLKLQGVSDLENLFVMPMEEKQILAKSGDGFGSSSRPDFSSWKR